MGIKKYTAYTPSRRHMTGSDFAEITKSTPEKSLVVSKKNNAGRNAQGKITVRHRGGGSRRKLRIIDFKSIGLGFHQNRHQPILSNSQNGSNISISRNNHLIASLHHAQLNISPENPNQSIQPISAPIAILRPNKTSIIPLKALILSALKIPPALHHTLYGLLYLSRVQPRNLFQAQKRNHTANIEK